MSVEYDDRLVAKCYVELGYVTKEKGEYDESLRYHRKSLEIFERIDDPLGVADRHLDIADVYKAKGELKSAMTEYEKGLSLYEDVFLEESKKESENSTNTSLNSSYTSDLYQTKALSKSEEILSRSTGLIDEPVISPAIVVENSIKNDNSTKFSRIFIAIFLLFLTGAFLCSISSTILPFSMSNVNSSSNDEIGEQLRKFLLWRSDRWSMLSKTNRRLIDEFLRNSEIRSKTSLDKFEQILEILDLKMILVPR